MGSAVSLYDVQSRGRPSGREASVLRGRRSCRACRPCSISQHLGPDGRQRLLGVCARLGMVRCLRTISVRIWQGPAVHLAARRERKSVESHERRRDHVVGQASRRSLRSSRAGTGAPSAGPRKPRGARRLGPDASPPRPLDRLVRGQGGLDLPQLDPEAPHLHLVVDPTQALERPVGQPARQVARPVQPRPGRRRTGPPRTAPPSAPAGSRYPRRHARRRRCTAPRAPPPARLHRSSSTYTCVFAIGRRSSTGLAGRSTRCHRSTRPSSPSARTCSTARPPAPSSASARSRGSASPPHSTSERRGPSPPRLEQQPPRRRRRLHHRRARSRPAARAADRRPSATSRLATTHARPPRSGRNSSSTAMSNDSVVTASSASPRGPGPAFGAIDAEEVHQRPVRDRHPLRLARRARRVDHVRQVLRVAVAARAQRSLRPAPRSLLPSSTVQQHRPASREPQVSSDVALRHQHRAPPSPHHVRQPLRRVTPGRAARTPRPPSGSAASATTIRRRPLHAQADPTPRGPPPTRRCRAKRFASASSRPYDQRGRRARTRRPPRPASAIPVPRPAPSTQASSRIIGRRRVPLGELAPLRRRSATASRPMRTLRVRHDPCDAASGSGPASRRDRRRIEEVGAVVRAHPSRPSWFSTNPSSGRSGPRAARPVRRSSLQVADRGLRFRASWNEKRCCTIGVRLRSRGTSSSSTRSSNGISSWLKASSVALRTVRSSAAKLIPVDVGPQHERVDEEPDQPLGLGPASRSHGRADAYVALPV